MRPSTRSTSGHNSETRETSQLTVANNPSRPRTRDEESSSSSPSLCKSQTGQPQSPSQSDLDNLSRSRARFQKSQPSTRSTSLYNSETGQPQSPSQSGVIDSPSQLRARFEKALTSPASLSNSETGQPQSPSQSGVVDSPSQSRTEFEKPTTRSASRQNSETGETRPPRQLAVDDSTSRSRTRDEEPTTLSAYWRKSETRQPQSLSNSDDEESLAELRRKLRCAYGHVNEIPIGFTTNKRRELKPLHDSNCCIHMAPEGPLSIILLRNNNINDRGHIVGLLTGESQECTGSTDAVPEGKMNLNLMTAIKSRLPIRILRASTLRSVFAPKTGYRYDGLYKCEACQPEILDNKLIFKFLLQRETNQGPAPWEDSTTFNLSHTRKVVERVEIISEPQYNSASSNPLRYLDFQVELDGFSLAEEDYLMIDTQVKVEFPTVHNLMEDSRDSVISLDSCTESFQNRDNTEENPDSSDEKIDLRQSCASVVKIFNCANTKDRYNNSREYNSEWESDVESETLKSEPHANQSDGETTPSREEITTDYHNVNNDFRLHLKEEETPSRNHEENGISSFIEIIENPPYKAEKLGNDNHFCSDDVDINTNETFLTSDTIKSGDNCDPRDRNSEVISYKSINSPKSDDNFDVRSDSQEYVLASENTCGENDSHSMHMCNPSCEVSGKCVIKAHDRLYGPSFVSLSPKYLNILNSVPEKNEQGEISKNINLSSVSNDNNGWDSDQDKKKCISGISTMSFSENGFTINAINESITLSDSESEVEPREWWNVSDNKSKPKITPSNPVDSDSDARSPHFKEPPPGYCKKCTPPPYLIEDLLGDLSSVFYYFYTDFFCLCKSNSKLYSENSDFFNKMNTVVSILNSVNPKYMVGILAFLIYGRSPDLIKELELHIKNDTCKKRGRRKKKNKLVLKDEVNGSYVLFEKNNQFSLVQGEGTSYERVINLDRVVLGTKRKARVPASEGNLKENRISQKINGIKKRRKVKKVVDKLIDGTSWERVITLDKDPKVTQAKEWIPADKANLRDDSESTSRFSTDEIHINPKQRRVRRRKVKEGDHKKLKIESNFLMSNDDFTPSTSSFAGFNTIEIPAAENDIDIWKESVSPFLDYCSDFKGFTGVARKKSAKKKSVFLDWIEGTSKGFFT